jgi:hypothetical protein
VVLGARANLEESLHAPPGAVLLVAGPSSILIHAHSSEADAGAVLNRNETR